MPNPKREPPKTASVPSERQAHFASELRAVEAAIKTQETWIEAHRGLLTKLRQERDQLRDLTVQLREPKLKRKGKP